MNKPNDVISVLLDAITTIKDQNIDLLDINNELRKTGYLLLTLVDKKGTE